MRGQESIRDYLLDGSPVTLGRAAENAVTLDGSTVSRYHARIEWDGSQAYLTDLGSANGSSINETAIPPNVPSPVHYGDNVLIGDYQLVLNVPVAGQVERAGLPARPLNGETSALLTRAVPASLSLLVEKGTRPGGAFRVSGRGLEGAASLRYLWRQDNRFLNMPRLKAPPRPGLFRPCLLPRRARLSRPRPYRGRALPAGPLLRLGAEELRLPVRHRLPRRPGAGKGSHAAHSRSPQRVSRRCGAGKRAKIEQTCPDRHLDLVLAPTEP